MSRIQHLFLSLALVAGAGVATPALAQSFSAGVRVDLPSLVQAVSPYGNWVDDSTYGRVFMPSSDYTPYSNGHWEGQTWIEDASDPIGSIVCHYGRWVYADAYGRYVWIPDTTWGPGYVDWQTYNYGGESYVGWAPLAPARFANYYAPYSSYRWAPSRYLRHRELSRYYVPARRVYDWGWRGHERRTYEQPTYRTYQQPTYRHYEQPTYRHYEQPTYRHESARSGHESHGGRWHR